MTAITFTRLDCKSCSKKEQSLWTLPRKQDRDGNQRVMQLYGFWSNGTIRAPWQRLSSQFYLTKPVRATP